MSPLATYRKRKSAMTDRELMADVLNDICAARLCSVNSMSSRKEMLRLMEGAIGKLREAIEELMKEGK